MYLPAVLPTGLSLSYLLYPDHKDRHYYMGHFNNKAKTKVFPVQLRDADSKKYTSRVRQKLAPHWWDSFMNEEWRSECGSL